MRIERVIDSADRLGECPLWDERSQALWWVDILAPAIKKLSNGKLETYAMPQPVGSIAFRAKGGLAAMQTAIYVWEDEKLRLLAAPHGHAKDHRFNDGRCDRAGRFWAGTMKDPEHTPTGSLYRIDKDGSSTGMKTKIKVPNSLAWSPDGRTMYFADSPRRIPDSPAARASTPTAACGTPSTAARGSTRCTSPPPQAAACTQSPARLRDSPKRVSPVSA